MYCLISQNLNQRSYRIKCFDNYYAQVVSSRRLLDLYIDAPELPQDLRLDGDITTPVEERQIITKAHLNAIDLGCDRTRNLKHRRYAFSYNSSESYTHCVINELNCFEMLKTYNEKLWIKFIQEGQVYIGVDCGIEEYWTDNNAFRSQDGATSHTSERSLTRIHQCSLKSGLTDRLYKLQCPVDQS
ncbi:hypothetical protein ANN_08226 [Periplaneta americana]|uniref:Uncharacterized protein n=1 Tax=Periplaneta americana TaxID=6978 RepID=A0ABQ8T1H6_PERAM|nr:hypothetical protein ANN_08226 [Periplaneta americana]